MTDANIKNCDHEYVTATSTGLETCKHCGIARDTKPQGIVSPFYAKPRVISTTELPKELEEHIMKAKAKELTDDIFKQIFDKTQSNCCLVISFDGHNSKDNILDSMHVSGKGVRQEEIAPLLRLVADLLSGKGKGTLIIREEDSK